MDYENARQRAIKFIALSKKTKHEVINKLEKLSFDEQVISRVVYDLENIGYIDDIDYILSYIKQNIKFLKYSKFEIKQKLLQKGLDKAEVDKQIVLLDNIKYDKELIKKLLDTKLKNMDMQKQKAYLYRRGLGLEGVIFNEQETN